MIFKNSIIIPTKSSFTSNMVNESKHRETAIFNFLLNSFSNIYRLSPFYFFFINTDKKYRNNI